MWGTGRDYWFHTVAHCGRRHDREPELLEAHIMLILAVNIGSFIRATKSETVGFLFCRSLKELWLIYSIER